LIALRRSSRLLLRRSRILILPIVFGLALLFWPAGALRSDNFVFYFPNARQLLPLEVIRNAKYLPLLQVLNLLGKVSGLQERRNTLKVWFANSQLELRQDERKVRVDKLSLDLAEPVRVSNGQWVVPVDFLTSVLPRLTHQVVEYQVGTNRIFVGDVRPCSFTVRLDQVGNGARLTVQFTDKVTVKTASKNGKWVMFLGDRPVEPLEPAYHFQDPYLTELRFDDQDGVPKLILTPTMEGLNFYPVLAEGGKVLLADVLRPPPAVVAQQIPSPAAQALPGQAPARGTQAVAGTTGEAPAAPPGPPLPVVVLDAGHGGEESGGRSRDGVLEKDLVAQLVARVRLALLSTERFRIMLTRTGDVNPSFDQRTAAANVAGAVAFLTFHAGDLGAASPRIAVYSYQPSSPPAPMDPVGQGPRPIFLPWIRAQQAHLDESHQLALALQEQLARLAGVTADAPLAAPVRMLRSVNAPAVAVEIGRLAPDADAAPLANPDLLQRLATALAQAIVSFTGKGA
jgi:N-acetylmuramoyl-L-alanine amidase